jgi:diacylglycerol kinase (ATP)
MRPLFIVNPTAGGARARRLVPQIEAAIRQRGADASIVVTARPGHATELSQRAADDGYAPIVGVGGDGTLHEIVNGLLPHREPPLLAVVPCGAGNDFARCIGLPIESQRALELVWTGTERVLDVATCDKRFFLNVGGLGFDARVARAASQMPKALRIGSLPYVAGVLLALARNTADDLVIQLDERTLRRRCLMVAVANGRFYGGGMMICPDANRMDGLLDVCIVSEAGRREVLQLLPKVFSGGHVGHPKVEFHRPKRARGGSSDV